MSNNLADLLCFSHLRWNFVYQRPQHLVSRYASHQRAFYFEEPIEGDYGFQLTRSEGVVVVTPSIPSAADDASRILHQQQVVDRVIKSHSVHNYVSWYYTPMALPFTRHLSPVATVFDCMDELSRFDFAPRDLVALETELLEKADVVFTGGVSLYEAKRSRHRNVHCFPSSVDFQHFSKARKEQDDPADQAGIPHPRLGYAGVIDERMDLETLARAAALRPDWHFVMVGPLAKLREDQLPKAENIHWLGGKKYAELPAYMSGWDVGLLPFALNKATQFISPTKTPEYLAAGLPVVSTPIRDVVRPYQELGLVHIASDAPPFVSAIELALQDDRVVRLQAADRYLKSRSWDATWTEMRKCIARAAGSTTGSSASPPPLQEQPRGTVRAVGLES